MSKPVSWSKFADSRPLSNVPAERVGYLQQAQEISATRGRILAYSVADIEKAWRILKAANMPVAAIRCLERLAREQAFESGKAIEEFGK